MKRTRVNDINGDCKANSCLISPVCTIWKANTVSKVFIAAVSSLSLERWRGQAPQTELQGSGGWLESADPFQKRKGVHPPEIPGVLTENHGHLAGTFSSLQSVIGVTWNKPQGSHSQNNFPSWMHGERVRVEKCVDGLRAVEFQLTVCLWKFIFSYIISCLNTVLEHGGNKKLELCLRAGELFVITHQMSIDKQQSGLLMNSRRKRWRAGLNGLVLLKQQESSFSLILTWKKTREVSRTERSCDWDFAEAWFQQCIIFLEYLWFRGDFFLSLFCLC